MSARCFGLWVLPTGRIVFDPMVPGHEAFYRAFDAHEKLAGPRTQRLEFVAAARHRPGDARMLDVGCGRGGFRAPVPGTR